MRAHPEEVEHLRAAMDKTAARKLQKEVNETEVEEDEDTLQAKVVQLAAMVRASTHTVVYTGAGVSTAAEIPDYRGPQGIWTMHQKGEHNASAAARAAVMGKAFVDARPTLSHMALAQLGAKGLMHHLISQNVDGLHLRSGLPQSKLCEIHGNVFRERCTSCGREYLRGHDVTASSAYHRHSTSNNCDQRACGEGTLADTIVYFGEKLWEEELETSQEQSEKADLAIFLGSSLKVLSPPPPHLPAPPDFRTLAPPPTPHPNPSSPRTPRPPPTPSLTRLSRCCNTTSSSGSILQSRGGRSLQ